MVVECPKLVIADYAPDVESALISFKKIVSFHLCCLREEGEPIPPSDQTAEGFFIRARGSGCPSEGGINQLGGPIRTFLASPTALSGAPSTKTVHGYHREGPALSSFPW